MGVWCAIPIAAFSRWGGGSCHRATYKLGSPEPNRIQGNGPCEVSMYIGSGKVVSPCVRLIVTESCFSFVSKFVGLMLRAGRTSWVFVLCSVFSHVLRLQARFPWVAPREGRAAHGPRHPPLHLPMRLVKGYDCLPVLCSVGL